MAKAGGTSKTLTDDELASECIRVVAKLYRKYPLVRTSEGWLAPIDWSLAAEVDLKDKNIQALTEKLSVTRAESHLGEVYRLIDQMLALSAKYDDLRRQITALAIDRLEQEGKEAISDREVASGYIDIESRVANSEALGQEAWADATQQSADTLQQMQNNPGYNVVLGLEPQYIAHARATANTGSIYSIYKTVHDRETPDKAHLDNDSIWITDPWNAQTPPLPAGKVPEIYAGPPAATGTMSLRKLEYRITYAQVSLEAYAQKTQLISQAELSVGLAKSAQHSAGAKRAWADWKASEARSRAEQIALSKLINAVKRKAADDPGGPTEIGRNLSELRTLFVGQLAECLSKLDLSLFAAETMFCLSASKPRPTIKGWDDRQGSFLIALAAWCQDFRIQVEQALGRDGTLLLPVSLKLLLGAKFDQELARARRAKSDEISFVFQLPLTNFSGFEAIRIAGVTGYASVGVGKATGPWSARVRPPVQTNNLNGGRSTPSFGQPERWTDLGRIVERNSPRAPDVNGLSALRNLQPLSPAGQAKPIASWLLNLKRWSISGEDGCDLKDLQLDIILNVRSA